MIYNNNFLLALCLTNINNVTYTSSDALLGIKDILVTHPAELKLHKIAVIEKLRERIGDDDKIVRETLYQLFKSVIFPGCSKVFMVITKYFPYEALQLFSFVFFRVHAPWIPLI